MHFQITHTDGNARAGRLSLPGSRVVQTPVFMPVGTQAAVKTLSEADLRFLEVQMILTNAYHLYLRPGSEIIKEKGGLHAFMNWQGGIITDSGGYQIFSMSDLTKITADGVTFTSHLDGSRHVFTPESNLRLQHQLGADIIMTLDVCVKYPSPAEEVRRAVELTSAWSRRCLSEHEKGNSAQSLFAIVQGGVSPEARRISAQELCALPFPGYAIGGLSVGEGPILMNHMLDVLHPLLPEGKPRYLMGVGTPLDLWEAVARGVDMMDCAMPTRIARNGTLYTSRGRLVVKNAAYARDGAAPDPECACPLCTRHSRAYLRHLFHTHEISALRLSTLHNLTFMINLTKFIGTSIQNGVFAEAREEFIKKYRSGDIPE
ncbi:tRNA guanosine(34) transglycosylase Tgt [candidate division FCPU426 bacterium]|nr:tRNA guanosine(34) transglycosylase Tgt [candidate division FCPU426 bacterium]